MLNKKANSGLIAIVIILIAIVFISWLVNVRSRECNTNTDCGEDYYCGSDFACHEIPIIEKTVVQRNLTLPILFICLTAVAIVIILRWDKLFKNKEKTEKVEKKPSKKQK